VVEHQLEATIDATSDSKAAMGIHMGISVAIVVPASVGFGPVPRAKNTLKVTGMDVTPKKAE
jgi:hypothetical protein